MNTIYFDSPLSETVRRQLIFQGDLFVFSPRPASLALCQFADELIRKAFGKLSPEKAQYSLSVEEYAATLSKLKPEFINHPKSKECIQAIVKEFNCEPVTTYFDVPRMRTSTSDGYLTTGIAYAWHPHRDTWYSAPQCQINWWIPIYSIDTNHGVAFTRATGNSQSKTTRRNTTTINGTKNSGRTHQSISRRILVHYRGQRKR